MTGDRDPKAGKTDKLALERRDKFYGWVGLGQLSVLDFSVKIYPIFSVDVRDRDGNFVGMVLCDANSLMNLSQLSTLLFENGN